VSQFRQTLECWQCGRPSEHSLFCRYCDSLQPPVADYFRFFGLEPRLKIDAAQLEKRFYELSRRLHPDRYLRRSPVEQQYSLEATAILNDAYRVLRDPVARAEYVLKQAGFESAEPRAKALDPALLEEVFELNEALEALRRGAASARGSLEQARRRFLDLRAAIDGELEDLFARYDESRTRPVLAEIRKLLDRRKYVQNLVEQLDRELSTEQADAVTPDRL
jgi:molecular chaperone HscB